ncbi:hypothetical protein CPB85DRAFT_1317381 [Mucidula mucida]|nr:hypothetical protein CPB85DRAFT_1317381 [Mucidula mucida]
MFPDYLLYPEDRPPPPHASPRAGKPRAQPKKHYCPLCRRAFNRPSNLAIHMNIHTGVTPYVCTFPACGRAFNVKANMHRHYRNTHDQEHRASSRSPRTSVSPPEPSPSPTPSTFPLVTPVQWSGSSYTSQESAHT